MVDRYVLTADRLHICSYWDIEVTPKSMEHLRCIGLEGERVCQVMWGCGIRALVGAAFGRKRHLLDLKEVRCLYYYYLGGT